MGGLRMGGEANKKRPRVLKRWRNTQKIKLFEIFFRGGGSVLFFMKGKKILSFVWSIFISKKI